MAFERNSLVAVASLVAAVSVLAGCGGGGQSDAERRDAVQAVVERFGKAFAARDGAVICRELLAPELQRSVEGVGLTCEQALQQSAASVKQPKLEVLGVAVRGDRGYATVRSTASGQEASIDRIALVENEAGWRITALNTEDEIPSDRQPKVGPPTKIKP